MRFSKNFINEIIAEGIKGLIEIVPSSIEDQDIRHFIMEKHYLKKFPPAIRKVYKIYMKQLDESKKAIGCCIFGDAWPQKHFLKLPDKIDDEDRQDIEIGKIRPEEFIISSKEMVDLKRFYIEPDVKNIESYSLRLCLERLKLERPDIKVVTTYSWAKAGHVGGIYQALGAIYLGENKETNMFKYCFILRGINNRTIEFIKKYFNKPYPKKDKLQTKKIDFSKKDVIRLRGMNLDLYKKYYEDLFNHKLSDEQIEDYEERVANAIKRSFSHRHLMSVFNIFAYIFSEVLHRRSEIVEKAILQKNFKNVRHNPSNAPIDLSKYQKWPIIDGVIKYVKEVIGDHWPEFEEKLSDSPFNSAYYYAKTGLLPEEPDTEPEIKDPPIAIGNKVMVPEVPIGEV